MPGDDVDDKHETNEQRLRIDEKFGSDADNINAEAVGH